MTFSILLIKLRHYGDVLLATLVINSLKRHFIGVDSVATHMAAALQTPLVALFGASKLAHWRPWQARGEVIWAGDYGYLPDPDCVDTDTGQRYLSLIPPAVIIDAALRMLTQ